MHDVDSYMQDLSQWKKRKLDQDSKFKEEELKAVKWNDEQRRRINERKYEEDEVERQLEDMIQNRR